MGKIDELEKVIQTLSKKTEDLFGKYKISVQICIMEKRSTHYGDVQKWIEKVIDSCETHTQARSVRSLISNFEKQMIRNKIDIPIRYTIGNDLRNMVSYKIKEIQGKYLES